MSKKMIKLCSVILAAMTIPFSLFACQKKEVENTSEETGYVRESFTSFAKAYDKNDENKRLALVENGASKYVIVTPSQMSSAVLYAVSELQTFLLQATGVELQVINDQEISYDETKYYISVGPTKILQESNIDVSYELLGRDGAVVKLCGNQIILGAAESDTNYGFLYAVYDFLEYAIDLKIYADTEIVYTRTSYIPLREYNSVNIPDIALRSYPWTKIFYRNSAYNAARMRLYAAAQGMSTMDGSLTSLSTIHNLYDLVSPNDYKESNPEWFSYYGANNAGEIVLIEHGQLCFTNQELINQLTENAILYVNEHPTETILPISVNDNEKCCQCDNCMAAAENYGGKASGAYLNAINTVARAVKQHLAGQQRQVEVMLLAYRQYRDAPSNITAEDNVIVYMAPIERCYKHAIDGCEMNEAAYKTLKDWAAISSNIGIYDYATEFTNYYMYLNDWNRLKRDLMIYEEMGVMWNRPLGNVYNMVSPFQDLRIWVFSQLAWDSSLNTDTLVNDFMANYYGVAGKSMKQYYDTWSARYSVVENISDKMYYHQYIYFNNVDFYNQNVFTHNFLKEVLALVDQALADIKSAGYDAQREKQLLDRVEMERFFVVYTLMKFYDINYTESECKAYQEYLDYYHEYFGIDYYREGKPI